MPYYDPVNELIDGVFGYPQLYRPSNYNSAQKLWRKQVDLSGYRPQDITVNREKSKDDKEVLIIHAKHTHGDDFNELKRTVPLPDEIDIDKLKLHLSDQGVFTLQAPYKPKQSSQQLSMFSDLLGSQLSTLPNTQILSDGKGGELFQADVNVSGYKPEEIKIEQTGDQILITAKQDNSTEDSTSVREMRRCLSIPAGVQIDQISSQLNQSDGVLRLAAPYVRPEKPALESRNIPVQLTPSENDKSEQ
jgi:HSP20 family molecular chaperone IbpA